MSQENVDALRGAIATFNAHGIDAALAYFDPDLEWWAPPDWLEDRLYRGHQGLRQLATYWTQNFEEYRVEPERFVDLGDRVVALLHQSGRIKGSGDQIKQPIGYVAEVRDATISRVEIYFSWSETLAAAGLRE